MQCVRLPVKSSFVVFRSPLLFNTKYMMLEMPIFLMPSGKCSYERIKNLKIKYVQ